MTSQDSFAPQNAGLPANEPTRPSTFENVHLLVRLILTALTLTAAATVATEITGPVRICSALAFFCLVPGAAIVRQLRPLGAMATWGLAVPMSLAANCAVALVAVWTHTYHPLVLLFLTGAVSLFGLWRPRSES